MNFSCLATQKSVCSNSCINMDWVCCNNTATIRSVKFISINHCTFVLVNSQLWAFFIFESNHGDIQYWTMHVSCQELLRKKEILHKCICKFHWQYWIHLYPTTMCFKVVHTVTWNPICWWQGQTATEACTDTTKSLRHLNKIKLSPKK